jgi:hypothetical protein
MSKSNVLGRNAARLLIIIIIIIIITVPNNRPDIIIRDNEKGTCMLIDVAISGDRNVIKKEAKKILKYKDLTIEIHHMWNVKTRVITSNNWSDWNHLKIIQKIRDQHTRKP